MRFDKTTLVAVLIAGALPFATTATAAPLAQPLLAKPESQGSVEVVKFRRGHVARHHWWGGPGLAFGTGLAVGSAFAAPYAYGPYDRSYGYESYGYDPGYARVPAAPRSGYGTMDCSGMDGPMQSSYPTWACRGVPNVNFPYRR
jgi:hypothetical protein